MTILATGAAADNLLRCRWQDRNVKRRYGRFKRVNVGITNRDGDGVVGRCVLATSGVNVVSTVTAVVVCNIGSKVAVIAAPR